MRPWHAPKGMPLTNAVWKMKTNVKAQEEDESAQVWTRLITDAQEAIATTAPIAPSTTIRLPRSSTYAPQNT